MEVLEQWANIHDALIEKLQDDKTYQFINVLARSDITATVFTGLIGLHANFNNTAGHAQSIISFSGLGKLDMILNETKTKVLKCISNLTNYIFDEMTVEEAEMAPLSSKLSLLLPHLIDSLAVFAVDPNMSSLLLNESFSELIVSLLDVLIIACNQQKFQEVFIQNKGKLLVSICLNFIKTSEVEADLIVEDAQEFVNLAIDSCDKQKSETVKTHACKLFENLCDNIDGSTTFAAIFCCNAINKVYGKQITEEAFWDMESDPFLANTEPEFIVESCLLALTVMSYILPERSDLTVLFTNVMQININEMLEHKHIQPESTHL